MNNQEIEEIVINIIKEHFSKVITKIEKDFKKNFDKKRYNFLLNQFDNEILANMVFVSSFESKSGNAIEACVNDIARLRYGNKNVPKIINPRNIHHNLNEKNIRGQILVTDINTDSGDLAGIISSFRDNNKADDSKDIECRINQENIKQLLPKAQMFEDKQNFHSKPVDLAFFDGTDWNIFEIKAGGDLDSSNAPANIAKLLTIYSGLNVENTKIYFATIYHKQGEGNAWTGTVKKYLSYSDTILIGKDFWDKILPNNISYERFTELYKLALEKINLNQKVHKLIQGISKNV